MDPQREPRVVHTASRFLPYLGVPYEQSSTRWSRHRLGRGAPALLDGDAAWDIVRPSPLFTRSIHLAPPCTSDMSIQYYNGVDSHPKQCKAY